MKMNYQSVLIKAAIQKFYSAQSVIVYDSGLGILRKETNPYLKLITF